MASRVDTEGAGTSFKCTRADCTSLREELELLRGDLLELEGENEQLCEQLTTVQADASAREVQTQKKLSEQKIENEELHEKVTALMTQLQQQLDVHNEKENTTSPEMPLANPVNEKYLVLQLQNEALEKRLNELQEQLEREATAGIKAQQQVTQVAEKNKDERTELYTTLKENEILRNETAELHEAMKTMTTQVKEYQVSFTAMQDQLAAYREAVDEQTLEMMQLHTKVEELEQEKVHLEAQLIEMDEKESDVDGMIKDVKAKFDMERAVLLAELDELKRKLKQQQMIREQQVKEKIMPVSDEEEDKFTSIRGNASSDAEDLGRQVEMLQEWRIRDKITILELNQRILQQQSDLESLADHVNVDAEVEIAVKTAVHKHKTKLDSFEQENARLKKRLKEQQELVQNLELRQGILEKKLLNAEEWNVKYEKKAGLEDVVKFQKKLRLQLEQQQEMNVKLRQDLNEQVEAAGKINVAFQRLKAEVGKAADFEYDDLMIADHLKGQLAINVAVTKQLEAQIQDLEAERLRFLQKLRDQARLNGHKLYDQYGLTTEQWTAVEDFIDRVKQTPEAAKRLLDNFFEQTVALDKDQSALNQQSLLFELERKHDAKCEQNTLLLQDIERSNCELEDLRSQRLALAVSQPIVEPTDAGSELLRALEVAKVRSQRQDNVIYHLRVEIASLHKKKRDTEESGKDESSLVKGQSYPREASHENFASEASAQVCAGTQTLPCVENLKCEASDTVEYGKNEGDGGDESMPPLTEKESHCSEDNTLQKITQLTDAAVDLLPIEQKPSCTSLKATFNKDWSERADNIATIVAKTIEAQFALLQAQTGTLLPSIASATPAKNEKGAALSKNQASRSDDAEPMTCASSQSQSARETVDHVAFESEEEMNQQVDLMRELNVCLDELVTTEARNEELQEQLHKHEEIFQSLMDQHTVLYQHFFQMHAQYTNAEIRLRRDLDQMEEDKKAFQIKCQRYEAGLHLLDVQNKQSAGMISDTPMGGNGAHLRSEVIELTRKIATCEVNEARFKRKYHQLHTEWRSSMNHNKLLQQEWSEMERTLKYRVLYLEMWKQGADEMMERMEKTLEKSVLREFADKQQRMMAQVLKKYNTLNECYAELHAKYLEVHDLPAQLSRTKYSLRALQAEFSARIAGEGATCDPGIFRDRIAQLENELQEQLKHVKELEKVKCEKVVSDELVQTSEIEKDPADDNELRNENSLLYERINEVEQLYECLALECAKYKDIASLAASQANTLTTRAAQEQGNRDQQEEQLRDLIASSEDHAIVGELQHQLMQIKMTYQQFLVQYDRVSETQQQTHLKYQQLELDAEKKAQELFSTREKSRNEVQLLKNTIEEVKERDWIVRNTKWEAFRKRLDALEDELQTEQQRRKQLEKDLEDKQVQLPLSDFRPQQGNQGEVGRLKSQIDALTTRESLLMGQLEAVTKATGSEDKEGRAMAELKETKALNEDLMRQLEASQARISQLLELNGDLEAEKRALRCKYEDLELEMQYARIDVVGRQREQLDKQGDVDEGSIMAPLMRQKVGMYEKDQAELQQAAQVTIASLKQLVEEKNTLIDEYQRKLAVVRASSAQDKAQERLETTQLNRKLYEDNQRMIGQLKEAMGTISSMERSGKSKQALQAAQERHDQVLQEWKQSEIALEDAKQVIRELRMERQVLQNERDLAEARAGEALEEIVLLKEKVAECEKHSQKLDNQVTFAKRDMAKKEEKLKALRNAIIKLKEEFLKAEDRHAIEIVKAQHSINNELSARKRKEKERREEEEGEWKEEKTRLQSQVHMLQEKLAYLKKTQGQQVRRNKQIQYEEKEEKEEKNDFSEAQNQTLKEEIGRLQRLVKEKAVHEARTVDELERKNKVLHAQNLALREASTHVSAATTEVEDASENRGRIESERKLQRQVGVLMQRLKKKQADLTSKNSELECCLDRISKLETDIQTQQAKNEKERLATAANAPSVGASSIKQQLEEMERQNAFLHETLALKRREWEKLSTIQMEKHETQLQRLRRRLTRHGITSTDVDMEASNDFANEHGMSLQFRQEEQQYLVEQDIREELLALGDELRSKEQDMVSKDTRLLDLELEVESLRLEHKRLQRKLEHGHSGSDVTPKKLRGAGGRKSSWVTQERLELEEVIKTMKKVIEKLRTENEKLIKAAAKQAQVSPERVELMRRKLKEQKDAREQLEAQLKNLQMESGELKKDKLKLQQKLRAKAAFFSSSKSETSALELQLKNKDRQLLASEQELTDLRQQILQLNMQAERHDNAEDDARAERNEEERIKALEAQVIELEDENTKLTNELSAFDEDFFEEIEDLKYKYAQAVRDKRQLEKHLARHVHETSPASISLLD